MLRRSGTSCCQHAKPTRPRRDARRCAVLGAVLGLVVALLSALPGASPAWADGATSPARLLAMGSSYSVVLGVDGLAYATGYNDFGQLTGTESRTTLTPMSGLPAGVRATAAAASPTHSLVLGSDGTVYGTGNNAYGQLTGVGHRVTLTPLTGLPDGVRATAMAAGLWSTVLLGSDGVVYGAGYNYYGQLTGVGHRPKLTALTGLPGQVRAVAIAAGALSTLVIGSDGAVYGTGFNGDAQLTGSGDRAKLTPLTGLPVGVRAIAVSAGRYHSLVVGSNGVAYGTGANNRGELTGTGKRTTLTPLTGIATGERAIAVAAGEDHSLVLGSQGVAYGTGGNLEGQITGPGDRRTLAPLTGPGQHGLPVAIAAGAWRSLVLTSQGVVLGTGANAWGELTGSGDRSTLTVLTGQRPAPPRGPAISGRAVVGATVKVDAGAWAPAPTSYDYQWRRGGNAIAGATRATYQLTAKDWKTTLTVTVRGTRPEMAPGVHTSPPATVLKGPLRYQARKKPAIRGIARVGKVLTLKNAKKTGWSPKADALGYQWYRSGSPIVGATAPRYVVKPADLGKRLQVRVYGKKSWYATGGYLTKATGQIRR